MKLKNGTKIAIHISIKNLRYLFRSRWFRYYQNISYIIKYISNKSKNYFTRCRIFSRYSDFTDKKNASVFICYAKKICLNSRNAIHCHRCYRWQWIARERTPRILREST